MLSIQPTTESRFISPYVHFRDQTRFPSQRMICNGRNEIKATSNTTSLLLGIPPTTKACLKSAKHKTRGALAYAHGENPTTIKLVILIASVYNETPQMPKLALT